MIYNRNWLIFRLINWLDLRLNNWNDIVIDRLLNWLYNRNRVIDHRLDLLYDNWNILRLFNIAIGHHFSLKFYYFIFWLYDQNITPYLLTESFIFSMDKSIECTIFSNFLRSLKFYNNVNIFTWLHLFIYSTYIFIKNTELIAICINESGIFRPRIISFISKCPYFLEFFTLLNCKVFSKTLFHKSSFKNPFCISWFFIILYLRLGYLTLI